MAHEANAILAISSTDRYITNVPGNVNQPVSNTLISQYNGGKPYSNDFQITAPNALINGYIEKIVVSQIQLQYNVPTIIPGGNDFCIFYTETFPGSAVFEPAFFRMPYGFYYPGELASMLQAQLNISYDGDPQGTNFFVFYAQASNVDPAGNVIGNSGFTIQLDANGRRFYFPTPDEILNENLGITPDTVTNILKFYKLFGFDSRNQFPETTQTSFTSPTFLYTPYIDIYSDSLTNYQKLKDTDSSTFKRKGLVSRLYLSGVGNPVVTVQESIPLGVTLQVNGDMGNTITGTISTGNKTDALGSSPFVLTYDLNSPKVIKWSRDTAINSLDFQLRDCYGDLLFSVVPSDIGSNYTETFNTEWQMTLLCIEGD
jgi:hypothetical protein